MKTEIEKIAQQLVTANDWNQTEDVIIMHESEAEREYNDTSRACENISYPVAIRDADIELTWVDRGREHTLRRADEREFITEMAQPLLKQLCDAAERLYDSDQWNGADSVYVSDLCD